MEKDYSQASEDYYRVYILYRYPDLQAPALFQVGACHRELGQPREAVKSWQSLIEEFPESPLAKDADQLLKDLLAESAAP